MRGCTRVRGPASTGKTTRTSAVGPGPTDGVAAVLVVNAGSTSVKLRVVDESEETHEPTSLAEKFESSTFANWNAFRETEDSRYVALALPRG